MPARPDDSGHSGGGSGVTLSLEAPDTLLSKAVTYCLRPTINNKRLSIINVNPFFVSFVVINCMSFVILNKHSSLLTVLNAQPVADRTQTNAESNFRDIQRIVSAVQRYEEKRKLNKFISTAWLNPSRDFHLQPINPASALRLWRGPPCGDLVIF